MSNVHSIIFLFLNLEIPASIWSTSLYSSVERVAGEILHSDTVENKLSFHCYTDVCKKGQQFLFCLRKLAKLEMGDTLVYFSLKTSIQSFSTIQ